MVLPDFGTVRSHQPRPLLSPVPIDLHARPIAAQKTQRASTHMRGATLKPACHFGAHPADQSPAPRLFSLSVRSRAFSQLARRAAAQPLAWSSSPTGLAQDPPLPRPTPPCASARRCALPARPASVRAGRLCCGRIGRRSCAPRAAIRPSLCPRRSLRLHVTRGRRYLSGSAGLVHGTRVCGARWRCIRIARVHVLAPCTRASSAQ